jgi:hypothetical protein
MLGARDADPPQAGKTQAKGSIRMSEVRIKQVFKPRLPLAAVKEILDLRRALRSMLEIWDRRDQSGWTAADVKQLEEIRKLVEGC